MAHTDITELGVPTIEMVISDVTKLIDKTKFPNLNSDEINDIIKHKVIVHKRQRSFGSLSGYKALNIADIIANKIILTCEEFNTKSDSKFKDQADVLEKMPCLFNIEIINQPSAKGGGRNKTVIATDVINEKCLDFLDSALTRLIKLLTNSLELLLCFSIALFQLDVLNNGLLKDKKSIALKILYPFTNLPYIDSTVP